MVAGSIDVDRDQRLDPHAARFDRWTSGRVVPSLGTNDGATPIAFQAWHRFKEAFAPELIHHACATSGRPVRRVLDPFGGSGTTALACQMLGISSATVEVNPFLADVIRAKLTHYDVDSLVAALATVRGRARRRPVSAREYFTFLPNSFVQSTGKERWLFDEHVADHLASILASIDRIASEEQRRLFRVVLGGLLVDVSNVVVSGKGRRYRRNWQRQTIAADQVSALFAQRAAAAIRDVQAFSDRPTVEATVINSDARNANLPGVFDLAVFSPPYPNSFDYTDVYNLELWLLGYITDAAENRRLRSSTLTSHVQVYRDYAMRPEGSATLDKVIKRLARTKDSLWSPWIPDMVGAYFADLLDVVERVLNSLAPTAECWIVIGDSQYAGIRIPVADILQELIVDRHLVSDMRSGPIRHMKSSPQQGWKPRLAESLIVLRRT